MSHTENNQIRRRLLTSTVTTVFSITLVLFILGLIGLLWINARKISTYARENVCLTVTLKENATDAQIQQLQSSLEQQRYTKTLTFISADQAAEMMKEELGEDFINFLDFNPLSSSMELFVKADYAQTDSLSWISNEISEKRAVQDVSYQKSLIDKMNVHIRKISMVMLLFSAMLILISVALIHNTIRLMIYSRRFVLYIMQLVGATRSFIRWPLIGKGMLHGAIGAVLAMLLLSGLMYGVNNQVAVLFRIEDIHLLILLYAGLLVVGVLMCALCTITAVNRYLRISLEKMYF